MKLGDGYVGFFCTILSILNICLRYFITKGPLETGPSLSLHSHFIVPIPRPLWHSDITSAAVISHLSAFPHSSICPRCSSSSLLTAHLSCVGEPRPGGPDGSTSCTIARLFSFPLPPPLRVLLGTLLCLPSALPVPDIQQVLSARLQRGSQQEW